MKLILSLFVTCGLIAVCCKSTRGEEPAQAFLDGLRARGYHDTALEYLKSLESSRMVPAGMRDVLGYETALTLVIASRSSGELEERYAMLDRAQNLLREFIEKQGSHPRMYAARSQLGNLIVERARIKVEEAKSGNAEVLKAEARKLYDQAFKECGLLEAAVTKELDLIPKVLNTRDREEAKLAERRKQLRADNLQTELLAAAIREEAADTVPAGSKEQTDYLVDAAALYDAIYKKYRSRLAGLYARMYQGRCNHRLGRTKDALGYYGELLDQPSEPQAFWELKTRTLRLAMESWLDPQERKYMEAIKQATAWIDAAPRSSQRSPDMLAIRLSLALALQMRAEEFEKRKSPDVATIRSSYSDALDNAEFVAAEEGDLQDKAAELVLSLGGRTKMDPAAPPENFAAAQKKGKESLDQMGPAAQEIVKLERLLGRSSPADQPRVKQQLNAARERLNEFQDNALASYRLAMQLADDDTLPSELNLVRYFVCYLYFAKNQLHDAAVVGDFVARRFPQSAGAKQCAKISLACYLKLLDLQGEEQNQFEIQRVADATRWLANQWANTPEAVESLSTVVPVMVNAGALDLACEFTQALPNGSRERAMADLITGQALWAEQLRGQNSVANSGKAGNVAVASDTAVATENAVEPERPGGKPDAVTFLLSGYENLPEDTVVDASVATAILSLAQALMASSGVQANGAEKGTLKTGRILEILENPTFGPLVLIAQEDESAANPLFVQEALRTALQAYVASMESDPVGMMEKAKQTMTRLREAVGTDVVGKKRMLAIYVSLAQTMEAKVLQASPESKKQMTGVFESFLGALSADASDPGTLNWVAETFSSLGSGLDTGAQTLNEDARVYYDKSINAFQNLLTKGELSPALKTQIRARLAAVKARKRDFAGAMADMETLLRDNPKAVNLQVEAARILQRWGARDPSKLSEAIRGTGTGESAVVWGWGKIANATMPHQQFRDTFFEARYEIAVCQLALARTLQAGSRQKQLEAARKTLEVTSKLYPDLGGEIWTTKYQELMRSVQ